MRAGKPAEPRMDRPEGARTTLTQRRLDQSPLLVGMTSRGTRRRAGAGIAPDVTNLPAKETKPAADEAPCSHIARFFLRPYQFNIRLVGSQHLRRLPGRKWIELFDSDQSNILNFFHFVLRQQIVVDFPGAKDDPADMCRIERVPNHFQKRATG